MAAAPPATPRTVVEPAPVPAAPESKAAAKPAESLPPPATTTRSPSPMPRCPADRTFRHPRPVIWPSLPLRPAPKSDPPSLIDAMKPVEPALSPTQPTGPKPVEPAPKSDPLPVPVIEPAPPPAGPKPDESPIPAPAHPVTPTSPPEVVNPAPAEPAPSPAAGPEDPGADQAADRGRTRAHRHRHGPGRPVRNLGRRRMPDPETEARLAPPAAVADAPMPREEVSRPRPGRPDPAHRRERRELLDDLPDLLRLGPLLQGPPPGQPPPRPPDRPALCRHDDQGPPVEALDASQIDPPSRSCANDDAATRASRSSTPARAARPSTTDGSSPVARAARSRKSRPVVDEPTRPSYRVRANETLRGIARDTLGDSHRYKEILELNRDAIDDPANLPTGLLLTLPDDAVVRSR